MPEISEWCGQDQPHPPHEWGKPAEHSGYVWSAQCSGHSGGAPVRAVDSRGRQIPAMLLDVPMTQGQEDAIQHILAGGDYRLKRGRKFGG